MSVIRYVLIITIVAVTAIIFGWLAPLLVSAKSTNTAIAGFVVIFVLYPAAVAMWLKAWKSTNKQKETHNES